MWGIYDPDIILGVVNHNKQKMKLTKNQKYKHNVYYVKNDYIRNNDISKKKLDYLNNRLGLNLSYDDTLNNKIVLNLCDLLYTNNIKLLSRERYIIKKLDKHFIGFLSNDNCYLNLRKIDDDKIYKSINKRYINYNIFNNFNNTEKFFTIPSIIDTSLNKPVRINIAEGPFDILSIIYNLIDDEHKYSQSINCAICGNSFYTLYKLFQTRYGFIDIEVHIYIDNDGHSKGITYLIKKLKEISIPLYIHNNDYKKEKDFGVPKARIIDKCNRLI